MKNWAVSAQEQTKLPTKVEDGPIKGLAGRYRPVLTHYGSGNSWPDGTGHEPGNYHTVLENQKSIITPATYT